MPRRPDMPPLRRGGPRSPTRSRSSRPGSRAPRARRRCRGDHAGDRRRATGRPTRAWCCSRASTPTAFASSPTTSRRRRRSSTPAARRRWSSTGASSTARCGSGARSSGSTTADSDAYFATRPRDSQLGAWASPQSRAARLARGARPSACAEAEARFAGGEVPRPGALGRLPAAPADDRVLAGPGRPPARPLPLRARRRAGGGSSGWRPERRAGSARLEPGARTRAARRARRSWSSARMPLRAARTRTPWPNASSSASSARSSAASWSGCGDDLRASASPRRAFARRSVSRTDQPPATASRASRRRTSLPFACRIARPWPSLSSPSASSSSTSSGRSSSRIRFEIAGRVRPRRRGELLLREPELLDQRRAGARLVDRVQVLAGDVLDQRRLHPPRRRPRRGPAPGPSSSPASRAARQRRSPAISS